MWRVREKGGEGVYALVAKLKFVGHDPFTN